MTCGGPLAGRISGKIGVATSTANEVAEGRRKTTPGLDHIPAKETVIALDILPPDPTSVYRYYDREGVLLYVGITRRGAARNREHNATKAWWRYVRRQTVDHYPTRAAALAREKALIQSHYPPFNRQHNPNHDEMQRLYVTRAALMEDETGRKWLAEQGASREARRIYATTGRRLPLKKRETLGDGIAVYSGRVTHLPLAREVEIPVGIPLRKPEEVGELVDVHTDKDKPLLLFRRTGPAKLPNAIFLKLNERHNPLVIYAAEAIAEVD